MDFLKAILKYPYTEKISPQAEEIQPPEVLKTNMQIKNRDELLLHIGFMESSGVGPSPAFYSVVDSLNKIPTDYSIISETVNNSISAISELTVLYGKCNKKITDGVSANNSDIHDIMTTIEYKIIDVIKNEINNSLYDSLTINDINNAENIINTTSTPTLAPRYIFNIIFTEIKNHLRKLHKKLF